MPARVLSECDRAEPLSRRAGAQDKEAFPGFMQGEIGNAMHACVSTHFESDNSSAAASARRIRSSPEDTFAGRHVTFEVQLWQFGTD